MNKSISQRVNRNENATAMGARIIHRGGGFRGNRVTHVTSGSSTIITLIPHGYTSTRVDHVDIESKRERERERERGR